MSESTLLTAESAAHPVVYLKDYEVPPYLIDSIDLKFDLRDEETLVTSQLILHRNPLSNDKEHILKLNGDSLQLISILMDGQVLAKDQYQVTPDFLMIKSVPDAFSLEIVVKIHPEKNTALSGLYRSADKYCTQCEAEGFRRITYFLDHPDVLACYTTTIIAEKARFPYLLSNGDLIESGSMADGRHFAKWVDPFKKPSYLFALVAGDFDVIEDVFVTQSGKKVDLRIYVEKGFKNQADHAMHSVKLAMRWDETAYGREYDLGTYMIVAIGDFNMGAMENKGLNIFNTKYVLARPDTATDEDYIHIMSVIAHEYFHNWTGNRVTCRDWFQLSLKEGLTIFRDQSFSEDTLSRAVMRIRDVCDLRESQFPEDAGPLAHPVRPESYIEINNFYTSTVYNKGSEVLRMMQTILGKAQFRKGMDLYFTRFDGQAVTIEDFVKTMEDVSGIDLKQFRLWYSQAGTPVVTVTDDFDASKQTYTLTFNQVCPATPGQADKLPMHIPISMALLDDQGQQLPESETVFQLKKDTEVVVFKNIKTKPVPSLLRNFSAPIKLNYAYTDAELLFLFGHDQDAFNRWEAGQKYVLRILLRLVKDYQQGKELQLPAELIATYGALLQQAPEDLFLLSEMLGLPTERYIGEQLPVVDVDAIHAAREFVVRGLAAALEAPLLAAYQKYHVAGAYHFTMQDVGRRQIKNRCLQLLSYLPQHADLVFKQFNAAINSNMTDTLAALSAIVNMDTPKRQEALTHFYDVWQRDALVMDKWLAIQAMTKLPFALEQVKMLMKSPAFDIKNPNKVYALIGAFGHQNRVYFHAKDGSGYVFLRETVLALDRINPHVSARMVKPLTTWERYDKERQVLMRQQLEAILADKKISTDLYELATKSLERV